MCLIVAIRIGFIDLFNDGGCLERHDSHRTDCHVLRCGEQGINNDTDK